MVSGSVFSQAMAASGAWLTALGELAHTEVVVAEHRLCAPLLDEIPRAIRIGTLVEDITDKDHAWAGFAGVDAAVRRRSCVRRR